MLNINISNSQSLSFLQRIPYTPSTFLSISQSPLALILYYIMWGSPLYAMNMIGKLVKETGMA